MRKKKDKSVVTAFSADQKFMDMLREFTHTLKIKDPDFNQSRFIREAVRDAMKEYRQRERKGQDSINAFKLDEWIEDPETVALPIIKMTQREMLEVIQKTKGTKMNTELRERIRGWNRAIELEQYKEMHRHDFIR